MQTYKGFTIAQSANAFQPKWRAETYRRTLRAKTLKELRAMIRAELQTEALLDIARDAGMAPFRHESSYHDNNAAERTMSDRSHFYDESTMRYFGMRVQAVRIEHNGLVMGTIATQKRGFHDSDGRGYVVNFHFCNGAHIGPKAGGEREYHNTRDQAERQYAETLATFDPAVLLRECLVDKRASARREWQKASAAVRKLGNRGAK